MRERDRARPSQPPGATQTPNPGVDMGEEEKVAQDGSEGAREGFYPGPMRLYGSEGLREGRKAREGAEEVREAEKAPPFIVCRHWRSFEEKCPDCEEGRPGWPPPDQPKLFTDIDGLQLERRVRALEQNVEALRSRVVRNEDLEEAREKKSSPLGLYSDTIFLESDQPRVSWDGETDDTRAIQQILDARAGRLEEVQTAAWRRLDSAASERRLLHDRVANNFVDLAERAGNLEGRVGSLDVRLSRLEERSRGAREGVGGAVIRVRVPGPGVYDVTVEKKPSSPHPPCDCPHEMRSDCATCNPDPKRESYRPVFDYDFSYDFTDKPCPPAPPPSVEPAEETSSGREKCAEGTAGGACQWCQTLREGGRAHIVYIDRHNAARQHLRPNFCPNCATPLREDGELRVGVQPVEGRDTCERGEG